MLIGQLNSNKPMYILYNSKENVYILLEKCPQFCTFEYDPQCGSDGKTYANPCTLKIATCESNGKITLAHGGDCGT